MMVPMSEINQLFENDCKEVFKDLAKDAHRVAKEFRKEDSRNDVVRLFMRSWFAVMRGMSKECAMVRLKMWYGVYPDKYYNKNGKELEKS